ncbi:hypothetical protein ACFX2I_019995 [Malus domestica]
MSSKGDVLARPRPLGEKKPDISLSLSPPAMEETAIISKLEAANTAGLHPLVAAYLQPFTELQNPKKTKKSTKSQDHQTLLRSLAKKFLPFLNRTLSLLPKRLADPSKLDDKFALELFDIYRLCLDCLAAVSSVLSASPHSFHYPRVRMVSCLVACGRYKDAESEGFRVLESLKAIECGSKKSMKSGRRFVPDVEKGGGDKDFGSLVGEIVVTLVKCAAMSQSKDSEVFERVLCLAEEVMPWFRVLDASTCEKLHRNLVAYLSRCTQFLVGELSVFNGDLVQKFCILTMTEYAKSPMKDTMVKFARTICSSLFLFQEDTFTLTRILFCLLDSLVHECKAEVENSGKEFVELIAYCAKKCQTTNTNLCGIIGSHLNKLAGDFHQAGTPFQLILRVYATGLHFVDRSMKSKVGHFQSFEGAIRVLLDDGDTVNRLSGLLGSLRSYFQIGCNDDSLLSNSQLSSDSGDSLNQMQKDRKNYLLCYFNALKFLCQPLTEFVNSGRKQIITNNEAASVSTEVCHIQGAFHQFCDVFLSLKMYRCTYEVDRDGFDGNSTLDVALAAFTLSIITKLNIQKSVQILENVITSAWIQPHGLKHLYVSLYNTGVHLYRNKELKEASQALNLCCKASWTRVIHLCEMFVHKQRASEVDLSEDAILDFYNECCTRSAFLLDVLNELQSYDAKRTLLESLENWSIAANLFGRLPGPLAVVKQWVKMECKRYKDVNVEDDAPTLYSLLLSYKKVPKKINEIVLEQELLAYEGMTAVNPKFCQKMQMKIIDFLLKDVYVTPNSWLQKSRILLKKGRALRLSGSKGLKDCIQCLSDAICLLSEIYDETCTHEISPCHQLAVAYCLRALSTQEAEPNSKRVLEDISAAINLWLGISTPANCSPADKCSMLSENTMLLLYNVIDLLSAKGCMDFHNDIHKLMIRLFKWRNVPLEKCVARFWECRRISHALCASPVNETFIMNLSDHCGELSKYAFWIDSLKDSTPLLLAFQHSFSFLFPNFSRGPWNHQNLFRSDITIDEVKEAAFELISQAPVSTWSAYIAGYLYYDLSERLVSNGRLIEALSYAKEAHNLRAKLFGGKFMFSSERQPKKYNEGGICQELTYSIHDMHMQRSVASEVWLFDTSSCDLESYYLSPWNALQCYLESTLQVGVILEIIGKGAEAEGFLQFGKAFSCSQSLPLFTIVFSTVLGKLYHKQQLWGLAEKELQSAKQYFGACSTDLSCMKCRLLLEATVNQNLGDLYQSIFENTRSTSSDKLSHAENLYKSAIAILNLSEWKNSVSCPEEECVEWTMPGKASLKDVGYCASSIYTVSEEKQHDNRKTTKEGLKSKMDAKKCKKTKNAPKLVVKNQVSVPEHNLRVTRSRYQSSQNQSISGNGIVQLGPSKLLQGKSECDSPDTFSKREFLLDLKSCEVAFGCNVTCICNQMRCWQCLPVEVMKSGLVKDLVHLKWEFVRRRLLLRLLTGLGKCLDSRGQTHETHEIIVQTVSVLVSRNPFCPITSTVPLTSLLDLMGKEIPGDVFCVERAEVLLNISWSSLKSYCSKETRSMCSDLPHIQLPKLVSWLMLAFVLCRDVPVLFQKVSRLLAAIFVLSTSSDLFSLSSSSKTLRENHWASYFHQASLGTHLSCQFFTNISGICNVQHLVNTEGSHVPGSTCLGSEKKNLLRLAPESIQELEGFVTLFFAGLPCTTIICISLLGSPYASFLQELLSFHTCVHAWILVSRLNLKSQPIVMLLPVDSVLEGDSSDDTSSGSVSVSDGKVGKRWCCPWGSTVVDRVAPEFRMILEESYLSSSIEEEEDTKENRALWWMWRNKLDRRLCKLLKNLEDLWFGPWKYVLLGESSNCKQLDLVHKKLARDLKSKCKMDIDESLLKVILGGSKYAFEGGGAYVSQLCFKKGCYIGKAGCSEENKWLASTNESNGYQKLSELAFQLIQGAVNELEGLDTVNREPIILVLDFEVQMLPWENIPILRNQEAYRMPSIGSIFATLEKNYHQDKVASSTKKPGGLSHALCQKASFPLIDPLDAFYLLNPGGDLGITQIEFEEWFRDQNLEGKAGCAPPAEELAEALKSHDLFIYIGHGSGVNYIPMHQIQSLENCAATLLMGCSSGCLTLNGCYVPHGPALSYLLAGSPVIIGNLWEVTDKDINRFAKAMLDGWLKERSSSSEGCAQCKVAEEFEALSITGCPGIAKKKVSRKKLPEACESDPMTISCDHRPKIGSFASQAREACSLPFLIGASPVCYGVPTGIRRKDL